MGFLSKLFGRRAAPSTVAADAIDPIKKSLGERLWSRFIGVGQLGYPGSWSSDRTIQVQQLTGWNYVAIMALADEIACQRPKAAFRVDQDDKTRPRGKSMTFGMRRKAFLPVQSDEELELVEADHPLLRLLVNPNPPDTCETFWLRTVMYLRLTGSCYWWTLKNSAGKPGEMYVLPSQWVWPKYGSPDGKIIDYYEIRPYGMGMGGYQWIKIPHEDMIVFQYPHPIHPFDGMSPLQAGAPWIDCAKSIDISRFAQHKNNGWPGMTVELAPEFSDPSETEIDAFRAKLMAVYAGERNSGKLLIVPAGCKITPQTRTPVEMDYNASFDQMRDTVLALHRVGKSIAGITEDVNYAGAAAARANFIYSTVRPCLMLIDGIITEKLAAQWDKRLVVYHDDKAPDDPAQKLTEWNAAMANGSATPNEYRKEILGLESYEHGGDDPLVPMGLSVLPLATGGDGLDLGDLSAADAAQYGQARIEGTTPQEDGEAGPRRPRIGQRGGQPATPEDNGDEAPETPEGLPEVQQTPARAELLSTVGGVTGAIDILTKVQDGSLERESAKHLIVLFFGISEEDAEKLIGPAQLKPAPAMTPPGANGKPDPAAMLGKSAGRNGHNRMAAAFAVAEKALERLSASNGRKPIVAGLQAALESPGSLTPAVVKSLADKLMGLTVGEAKRLTPGLKIKAGLVEAVADALHR